MAPPPEESTRRGLVPPEDAELPRPHPDAPAPGSVLPPHHRQCFGCGDLHPHGLHLTMTVGEGVSVHGVLEVTESQQGAPGLAHGGLVAAAFDDVLGALSWVLRAPAVTGRLETDYLRPVPIGSRLFIHARATAVHGRKVYAEGEGHLDAPDGPVAARAAGLFVRVPPSHFLEHGRPQDVARVREDPVLGQQLDGFEVGP